MLEDSADCLLGTRVVASRGFGVLGYAYIGGRRMHWQDSTG